MTQYIKFLAILLLISQATKGQDSLSKITPRTTFISLDIGRMPLNWVFLREKFLHGSFVNIEPGILWHQRSHPHQMVQIFGGYTSFSNAVSDGNIRLSGQGAYLKAGIDHTDYGYMVLLSNWQNSGQYSFMGSTFGNYTGLLETISQTRFGLEGYITINTRLGRRWRIRFMSHVIALLALDTTPDYRLPYVPGAGLTLGNSNTVQFSGGLNVQFQYRVHPKIIPSL